jgi:hypothetical protein
VIIIAAIALAFYKGVIPKDLMAGTNTIGNQETSGNPTTPSTGAAAMVATGDEIIVKEVTESLPYYYETYLEPGRYSLNVVTDKPVWIRVYHQVNFDEWKNTGVHGAVLAGTNLNENDKIENYNGEFIINRGEADKIYLLILGSETTTIKFKITQNIKYQ